MKHRRGAAILTDTYAILRRPVLTEKTHGQLPVKQATGQEQRARYTFDVHPKASKDQIAKAVEAAFGVKVESVNTLIVKPRAKSFRSASRRGTAGFTRLRKRAIIRLAKGSKVIDLV